MKMYGGQLVTDEQVEMAMDFLRDHSDDLASKKAQVSYLEQYGKSLKAILMGESNEKSAVAQERFAYSHPKYQDHLINYKVAVFEYEKARGLCEAAKLKIEIWRTSSANERGARL